MPDTATDYLQLPYTRRVAPDRGTHGEVLYLASVQELPGCESHGATAAEALENLEDAIALYIQSLLEEGLEPPVPGPGSKASAT